MERKIKIGLKMGEFEMKRFLAGMLAAVLVIETGTMSASAAVSTYGRHYSDLNQDGVCDYCNEKDGCNLDICNVKGKHFLDKDKDGICDNCKNGSSICKNQKSYRKNCKKYARQHNGHHSSHKGYHHRNW